MQRFVPVILAAGEGRRLGGCAKASLEIAGRTALEACLRTCRDAADRAPVTTPIATPVIVLGHHAEEVQRLIGRLPADRGALGPPRVVLNDDPDRGQTSSVQAGIAALPPDACAALVWPVDQPFVEAADLVGLIQAASRAPEAPIVLPSHAGRAGHPLLIRRALFSEIAALPPEAPLHTVIRPRRDATIFVDSANRGVLFDIDTPADLARAQSWAIEERSVP